MLETKALAWRTHKEGESEADCEDSVRGDANGKIFSVADGATQSFYARLWADELTSYFAKQPDGAFGNWAEWLSVPQQNWLDAVHRSLKAAPDDVYIYNDFHERRPGASTFVGLRLLPMEDGGQIPWEALVLGDSCLFHLRSGGKVCSYLKRTEAEFDFRTEAAETYPRTSQHSPTHLSSSAGQNSAVVETAPARPGDCFLLATDAFSRWMLARDNAREPVWGVVASLKSESEFQNLVSAARKDAVRPLQNDDVGLVVVRFGEVDTDFAAQQYEPKPAACLNQPEKPRVENADPRKLPLFRKHFRYARSPHSRISKRGSSPYVMFGTASALGLSLLVNFLLVMNLEKSAREREGGLQSIHSLIQMHASSIDRLSDELDKFNQELRNKLQISSDGGNKMGGQTESTPETKTSAGAKR